VDLVEERESGNRFALKRVPRDKLSDKWQQEQILNEKNLMAACASNFVMHLEATYRDEFQLSFLLELLPGGNLRELYFKQRLYGNEKFARFYAAGVALAINHLHTNCILHRDVKPDNV
jgi:serine/threonine protein kinase